MKSNSLKHLSSKTAIFVAVSLILGSFQASLSKADLIPLNGFFDLGEGFGNADNILTLKKPVGAGTESDIEKGGVALNGANDVYSGDANTNSGKSAIFTFGYLGITDASQIFFLWNQNEIGNTRTDTQINELRMDTYAPAGGQSSLLHWHLQYISMMFLTLE